MSGIWQAWVDAWAGDAGAAKFFAILFGSFLVLTFAIVRNKR
jgi:hypothetical protein